MRLLVLFQFILCIYSTRSNGNLLSVRAEGCEPAKEKNENRVQEKQTKKAEDALLQTEILKIRLPRHDDVSIYYHFRFLLIKPIFLPLFYRGL